MLIVDVGYNNLSGNIPSSRGVPSSLLATDLLEHDIIDIRKVKKLDFLSQGKKSTLRILLLELRA
ncbi:hypothetical protein DVH24_010972 [Malus domestica]|uniref:Leucine-rich repeat-containing N-terminal plant-type domain-containing protein n=1 Tax=Malus domestica TaxID=3750 RepID=A0A498JUN1_MALDO|nr:hypothetical protein DVH24_010972 [Malus domestica]